MFAWVAVIATLIIGPVIGASMAAVVLRSQLTLRTAVVAAVLSTAACLAATALGGWADSHSAFYNGRRMDRAPWGEDLRLRNWIAEHEIAIALIGSMGLAIAYSVYQRRRLRP